MSTDDYNNREIQLTGLRKLQTLDRLIQLIIR